MNIHEYQAKEILKGYGVRIQEGIVIDKIEDSVSAAEALKAQTGTGWFVVKAQIHAGGRGKGGGVKLAKNLDEVKERVSQILGMQLITHQTGPEGKKVNKVLISEDVYYPGDSEPKEYYISILFALLAASIAVSDRNVAVTTKKIRRMNTTSSMGVKSTLLSSFLRVPASFLIILYLTLF